MHLKVVFQSGQRIILFFPWGDAGEKEERKRTILFGIPDTKVSLSHEIIAKA